MNSFIYYKPVDFSIGFIVAKLIKRVYLCIFQLSNIIIKVVNYGVFNDEK